MLIFMDQGATDGEIRAVIRLTRGRDCKAHPIAGAGRLAIGNTGTRASLAHLVSRTF